MWSTTPNSRPGRSSCAFLDRALTGYGSPNDRRIAGRSQPPADNEQAVPPLFQGEQVSRHAAAIPSYSRTAFNRSALVTTVKDDSAIAAPASIGDNRMPATG